MALFDFKCEKCKKIEERIISISVETPVLCSCGGKMVKQFPDSFHFYLKYDPKKDRVSWGNEGYASTQRYKEYDKQAKGNVFSLGDKKK